MEEDQEPDQEQEQDHGADWMRHINEYLIAALIGLPNQQEPALPPLPPLPALPPPPAPPALPPSFLVIGSPVYPPILPTFPPPPPSSSASAPSLPWEPLPPLLLPPPEPSGLSGPSGLSESLERVGHIHYLEEKDRESQGPAKRSPTRLVRKRILGYRYLSLRSGKTFTFTERDGTRLLLPVHVEPNVYLRKILSRLPATVQGRLAFLAEFASEEDNEVVAIDALDSDEWILPSYQVTLSSLFTNLRDQLYTAYLQEMRLRRIFRGVLQRWRIRRIQKKEVISTDPITLTDPKKPVEVYDLQARTRYRFDASSLATWIESNLMYAEGGFSVPMNPRNPWTNQEWTYVQLVSIYQQLQAHGELRWAFTTFRKFNFQRSPWQLYHSSALTMSAIRTGLLQLDSYDAREMLEDFMFMKMEDLHLSPNQHVMRVYQQAMIRVPDHWYLQEWKAVAFLHYEAEHFRQNKNRMIHNRCDRILRKQDQFLEEMEAIGIPLN